MRSTVILVSLALITLAVAGVVWASSRVYSCTATLDHPCTVNFNGRMQEDEFQIDYRSGKLYIERIIP